MAGKKRGTTKAGGQPAKDYTAWVREIVQRNPSMGVPWYLMTSYLYYIRIPAVNVISDECFDWMCKHLLEHWESVEHPHKWLITPADLIAGTGYSLTEDKLPSMVIGAAEALLREAASGQGVDQSAPNI